MQARKAMHIWMKCILQLCTRSCSNMFSKPGTSESLGNLMHCWTRPNSSDFFSLCLDRPDGAYLQVYLNIQLCIWLGNSMQQHCTHIFDLHGNCQCQRDHAKDMLMVLFVDERRLFEWRLREVGICCVYKQSAGPIEWIVAAGFGGWGGCGLIYLYIYRVIHSWRG